MNIRKLAYTTLAGSVLSSAPSPYRPRRQPLPLLR
jgi:hypothetical protein